MTTSTVSPGEPHPAASEAERRAALSVALREMARRVVDTRRMAIAGIGVSGRRWEAAYRQAAVERRAALDESDRLRVQRDAVLAVCHAADAVWGGVVQVSDIRRALGVTS